MSHAPPRRETAVPVLPRLPGIGWERNIVRIRLVSAGSGGRGEDQVPRMRDTGEADIVGRCDVETKNARNFIDTIPGRTEYVSSPRNGIVRSDSLEATYESQATGVPVQWRTEDHVRSNRFEPVTCFSASAGEYSPNGTPKDRSAGTPPRCPFRRVTKSYGNATSLRVLRFGDHPGNVVPWWAR